MSLSLRTKEKNSILFKGKGKQLPPYIIKQLNVSGCFDYRHGKWVQENVRSVCPFIDQWHIDQFEVGKNQHPFIIKDIEEIKFMQLVRLSIDGNNVESIETLHKIYMLKLKLLDISSNKIAFISSLVKGNWPEIECAIMGGNLIQMGDSISKMKMEKMRFLNLDNKQSFQFHDLRFLVKGESLQKVWFQKDGRIRKQKNLIKVLQRKSSSFHLNQNFNIRL